MNQSYLVPLIQTSAIVFSLIGVLIGIRWSRNIAKRRATLDIFLADQTNQELLQQRGKLVAVARDEGLLSYVEESSWMTERSFFMSSILNRSELFAIGMKHDIIDEGIYKEYWRSATVADWIRVEEAVYCLRERIKRPKVYCEIEALAHRWATPEELSKMKFDKLSAALPS